MVSVRSKKNKKGKYNLLGQIRGYNGFRAETMALLVNTDPSPEQQ